MLDDDHAGAMTDHPPRFAQDEFDHARVLGRARGKLTRLGTGLDRGEVGVAPLALGDDLLRDHENIAFGSGLAGAYEAVRDQSRKVVAGLDHGDARQREERERAGTRSHRCAPPPPAALQLVTRSILIAITGSGARSIARYVHAWRGEAAARRRARHPPPATPPGHAP